MDKTIKQAIMFRDTANSYIASLRSKADMDRARKAQKNGTVPEPRDDRQFAARTKFEYALNKIIAKVSAQLNKDDAYYEKLQDLGAEYGSVDADKNLMLDHRGETKFTPEKQKEYNAAVRKLQSGNISFEPHYTPAEFIPDDLNEVLVTAFRGFVLPDDYELKEPSETTAPADESHTHP